ncbi:hypothetical protein N780_17785 [Pontibacillus chungwhensis BH030062]|uniref:Glycosyltransferase 2-like domain-containing protein n=1 Tax=Pontibacillus chungwhensis BH030062 TaxID=1385513 RepID=A0A0A2UT43_9BACI|nr:glycosyltransferase [Pontibacillus chungwhensis]KGP91104.1 hypothetical protein N780_17785 [Pontibacillus chungwhensis BH030062]
MITVITSTIREDMFDNLLANFLRQNVSPKELILILNSDSLDIDIYREKVKSYKSIHVEQRPSSTTLGECLNVASSKASYETIAKFDDDDYYGTDYLKQSLMDMEHHHAGVVGKSTYYIYFEENGWLTLFQNGKENARIQTTKTPLAGGTLVFKKGISSFPHLNKGEDIGFQKACIQRGIPLYSGSAEGYVLKRYGLGHGHSWTVSDDRLFHHCHKVALTNDFDHYFGKGSEKN